MANTAQFLRRQSSRDLHHTTTPKTLDNLELKVSNPVRFVVMLGRVGSAWFSTSHVVSIDQIGSSSSDWFNLIVEST